MGTSPGANAGRPGPVLLTLVGRRLRSSDGAGYHNGLSMLLSESATRLIATLRSYPAVQALVR
jgi:hypothetical protein